MLQLPREVQVAVANILPRSDIQSFRLTSRALQAAALDTFLRHYFTERNILYSDHGLRRLAEMFSQPGFLKELRTIRFVVVDVCG